MIIVYWVTADLYLVEKKETYETYAAGQRFYITGITFKIHTITQLI